MQIPFVNLTRESNLIKKDLLQATEYVIDSGNYILGEKVKELEECFASFCGVSNAIAVGNGSDGLKLIMKSLGIGLNDEVICPANSFIASSWAIVDVGAKPVFIDVRSDNYLLDLRLLEGAITPATKAILPVHLFGHPVNMDEVLAFAKENDLKVIEDCAQAVGSMWRGKPVGGFGDIGCFSFYSNKNISVGEGGMTSTSDDILHETLKSKRAHGMNSLVLDRHKGRSFSYDITNEGLNYRMDEIRAAMGIVQLAKLERNNSKRKNIYSTYIEMLKDTDIHVPFLNESMNSVSSHHIMPILLPEGIDRNKVVAQLKEDGIQSSMHYPAFWNFSSYKNIFDPNDTPVTKLICDRQLTLPLYPNMFQNKVELVIASLLKACN